MVVLADDSVDEGLDDHVLVEDSVLEGVLEGVLVLEGAAELEDDDW